MEKRSILQLVVDFFINIVLTGIALAASSRILSLTESEQLLVGLILFMCIIMLQINYKFILMAQGIQGTPSIREFIVQVGEKLTNLTNTDILMKDLNTDLKQITESIKSLSVKYGSNDRWVNIYWDKIQNLNNHLQLTIINEAFEFDATTFQSRSELDVYRGNPNDFFWAVSSYDAFNSFRTVDLTDFLKDVDYRFQAKKIVSIRRMFIYNQKKELDDKKFLLFVCLHAKSDYECKVILREDFDTIYRDFGDKMLYKDFGVHGNHYVWETPPDNLLTQVGIMCRNQVKYNKYTKLYEKLWDNAFQLNVRDDDILNLCKDRRIGDFRELVILVEDAGL